MRIVFILFVVGLILVSVACNSTSFVIEEHNKFVQNALEGDVIYRSYKYSRSVDEKTSEIIDECTMNKRFLKLNSIVVNPKFNECKFVLDFDYLEKLRSYVKDNNPSKYGKLILINQKTFEDTLYYYDSMNVIDLIQEFE